MVTGIPARKEIHGDAAAHRAGADHADLGDLPGRLIGGNVGDLRRLTLGEKDIALRLGLGCDDQRREQGALLGDALVERQVDRVPHRFDRFLPGLEAAEFARIGFADGLEDLGMAARRLELVRSVAHFLQWRPLGDQAPGEGKRGFTQLSLLGELVDDAPFLGLARAEGHARENDV